EASRDAEGHCPKCRCGYGIGPVGQSRGNLHMLRKGLRPWSALLVIPFLVAVAPTASAQEPVAEESRATIDSGEPLLEAPRRGAKAIRQLGELLEVAAARNDLRPAELRGLLRNDKSVWVDQDGLVYYVD